MSDDGVQRIVRASRIYDAQEVERRDGPRYVEAIRGAWVMRGIAFWSSPLSRSAVCDRAYLAERRHGIPFVWSL